MSPVRQIAKRLIPQKFKLRYFVHLKSRHSKPAENTVLRLLCSKEKAAIDIGANIGEISYYLAKYAKQNHAFEINPVIAEKLRQAKLANTTVYEIGLSDCRRSAAFRMPLAGSGPVSGLGTIETTNDLDGFAVATRELPVAMLDDFELKDVGIIKIDVEGHELAVLRGATKTLERERPSLIVEIVERRNGQTFAEIAQLMAGLSYGCYRLTGGFLIPASATKPGDNDFYFLQPHVADTVNGRLKELSA